MNFKIPKSFGELQEIYEGLIMRRKSFSDLDALSRQDLELLFKIVDHHLQTIDDRHAQLKNLIPKDVKPGRLSDGKAIGAIHFEPYRPSDDWKIITDIWIEVSGRIGGMTWRQRCLKQTLITDSQVILYYWYLVSHGELTPEPSQKKWFVEIGNQLGIKPGSFATGFKKFNNPKNRAAKGKGALTESLKRVWLVTGNYPEIRKTLRKDLER